MRVFGGEGQRWPWSLWSGRSWRIPAAGTPLITHTASGVESFHQSSQGAGPGCLTLAGLCCCLGSGSSDNTGVRGVLCPSKDSPCTSVSLPSPPLCSVHSTWPRPGQSAWWGLHQWATAAQPHPPQDSGDGPPRHPTLCHLPPAARLPWLCLQDPVPLPGDRFYPAWGHRRQQAQSECLCHRGWPVACGLGC